MKVTLLGLEFFINNLGCEALSYSFVSEIYAVAKNYGSRLEITTVVFADNGTPYIPETDIPIQCFKIHYKNPEFWKELHRLFQTSDMIFDFTMGDSFSDIYGDKRFVLDAMVKTMAVRSGTPFILGPQTYGPYKKAWVRKWAGWILKKADLVYSRDKESMEMAAALSGRDVILTTDVAFALPRENKVIEKKDKICIGFNPSGLLWKGGYTKDNQFGLKMDYQEYCERLCSIFSKENYEVYLIPHVGTKPTDEVGYESDYGVCSHLRKKYPEMHLVDNADTPMKVKGYLAEMDIFIGARMHATIGAFSSGVATIPVSYSRKFEGLYGSLNYDYVIHALSMTTEEAVDRTLEYVNNYKVLQKNVEESMKLVHQKQADFRESLSECMRKIGK